MRDIEIKALTDIVAEALGRGLSRSFHRPRRMRSDAANALFDGQERTILLAVRVTAGESLVPEMAECGGGAGFEVHVEAIEVPIEKGDTIELSAAAQDLGGVPVQRYGMRETWTDRMENS